MFFYLQAAQGGAKGTEEMSYSEGGRGPLQPLC